MLDRSEILPQPHLGLKVDPATSLFPQSELLTTNPTSLQLDLSQMHENNCSCSRQSREPRTWITDCAKGSEKSVKNMRVTSGVKLAIANC